MLWTEIWDFLSDFTDNLFNDNSVYKFDRVTVVVLIYAALILLISLGFLSIT